MSLDKINPYRFLEPISPATAIKLSKKRITINNYLAKYKSLPDCDFSVIEGAGGLLSPLASDGFNIDLIKKIISLGVKIIQLYGSTEVTPFAIHQRNKDIENCVGSIGKEGADCSIKLIDKSGNEVAEGEVGEICVKGLSLIHI